MFITVLERFVKVSLYAPAQIRIKKEKSAKIIQQCTKLYIYRQYIWNKRGG